MGLRSAVPSSVCNVDNSDVATCEDYSDTRATKENIGWIYYNFVCFRCSNRRRFGYHYEFLQMIIETDIGNDPDDFFTLCYLIAAGVNIDAIVITPGGFAQVAITKLLLEECGLNIPVGVSDVDKVNGNVNDMHSKIVHENRSCTWLASVKHDGYGHDIIASVANNESEFLIIGPATNIGRHLSSRLFFKASKATMQGGFLPYHLHNHDVVRLDSFEGKKFVPTFNLNGNRQAGLQFLDADISRRNMVGKNVCHTILFDKDMHQKMSYNNHPASILFKMGMDIYLKKHNDKKFHDPVAAVCHLHPEIGTWVRGKTIKETSGWTTELREDGDFILADIDRERFWEHITQWT